MKFSKLTLVKEYHNLINKKYPIRIYRTFNDKRYRWHFGFPKSLVKPILDLIETTPYWGDQHWKKDEGFYIYHLMVTTESKEVPLNRLNDLLNKFYRPQYNLCLTYISKHLR